MKKIGAIVGALLVGIGIVYLYFGAPAIPGSDTAHLEGTVIALPRHPEVNVTIHYAHGFDIGPTWNGYSEQDINGTWFGQELTASRWAVSVHPTKSLQINEDNDALYLIPFLVHDNLSAYVNDYEGNQDAGQLRQKNGEPEGQTSYVGLFSWNGTGAMSYRDAVFVGESIAVTDIQKDPTGEPGDFTVSFVGGGQEGFLDVRIRDGHLQELPRR